MDNSKATPKKRIMFRADGTMAIGMGHIYNCLTMAARMKAHDLLFLTREDCLPGILKIKEHGFRFATIDSNQDIERIIREFGPDIWVNDCLDTDEAYMKFLKKLVPRLVTIEDIGPGTRYADAVINALYDHHELPCDHLYEGPAYICLRDEFLDATPKEFSETAHNILVMFGGTDPENLNQKLYLVAKNISNLYPTLSFHFVTGIGYDADRFGVISDLQHNIHVYRNVPRVTEYMKQADLAVTSQGRTIYELATMGVPSIVLAQNSREMTHHFADLENGFIHLGLGNETELGTIQNTIQWLADTPTVRQSMRRLMLRHDFREGINRIKKIILGEADNGV